MHIFYKYSIVLLSINGNIYHLLQNDALIKRYGRSGAKKIPKSKQLDEADKLVLDYLGEEPVSGIPGLQATNVIPNEHSPKTSDKVPVKENSGKISDNVPVKENCPKKSANVPVIEKPSRLQKIIAKYTKKPATVTSSESETEPIYANRSSLSDDSCPLSDSQRSGSMFDETISNSNSTYSPPSSPSGDSG